MVYKKSKKTKQSKKSKKKYIKKGGSPEEQRRINISINEKSKNTENGLVLRALDVVKKVDEINENTDYDLKIEAFLFIREIKRVKKELKVFLENIILKILDNSDNIIVLNSIKYDIFEKTYVTFNYSYKYNEPSLSMLYNEHMYYNDTLNFNLTKDLEELIFSEEFKDKMSKIGTNFRIPNIYYSMLSDEGLSVEYNHFTSEKTLEFKFMTYKNEKLKNLLRYLFPKNGRFYVVNEMSKKIENLDIEEKNKIKNDILEILAEVKFFKN